MAQRRERAQRIVVPELINGKKVLVHRLQPPEEAPLDPAVARARGRIRTHRRASRPVVASTEQRGGEREAAAAAAPLRVVPGLNGASDCQMILKAPHTPLQASAGHHHTGSARHSKPAVSSGVRQLVASATAGTGVVSPGPAAYAVEQAQRRLLSPRSWRAAQGTFGTSAQ